MNLHYCRIIITAESSSDQLLFTWEMIDQPKSSTSGNTNPTLWAPGWHLLILYHPHHGSTICRFTTEAWSDCRSRPGETAGGYSPAYGRHLFTAEVLYSGQGKFFIHLEVLFGHLPSCPRSTPSWWSGCGGSGAVSSWQQGSQDVGSSVTRYLHRPCPRSLVSFKMDLQDYLLGYSTLQS